MNVTRRKRYLKARTATKTISVTDDGVHWRLVEIPVERKIYK